MKPLLRCLVVDVYLTLAVFYSPLSGAVPELEEMDRKIANDLRVSEAAHPGQVEAMNKNFLQALKKWRPKNKRQVTCVP